jgi:hypothetical protein
VGVGGVDLGCVVGEDDRVEGMQPSRSVTEMTLLPKCAYCSLIQIIQVTIRRR